MNNPIEESILIGPQKGEDVLLPQMTLIPTDIAFAFKPLQFPIRHALAMTISIKRKGNLCKCVV